MKKILKVSLIFLAVLAFIWLALYLIGFRLYRIPTGAMEPTISSNSYVIAKLSSDYKNEIENADIVIYESTKARGTLYAKRVIGLPGDRVRYSKGVLYNNGNIIDFPRMDGLDARMFPDVDITVPQDAVFVVGDNLANSADSRIYGPIPLNNIKGKVINRK